MNSINKSLNWFDFTKLPARVETLQRLHRAIEETSEIRMRTNKPEDIAKWHDAVERWQDYSGWGDQNFYVFENDCFLKALAAGETDAKECAITFLEYDCYYFRSGYMKAKLLTRLKHLDLAPAETRRLQKVVCNAILSTRPKSEFGYYARLLQKIGTPSLRRRIESLPVPDIPWMKARQTRCLQEIYWRNHSTGLETAPQKQ